nr:ABC transporter permease [Aeromicrobium stalagmiti]
MGQDIRFHGRVMLWIPATLKRYPRDVMRLLSEVSFGSGALAVIGGTIGVMLGMTLFVGSVVGMQGYAALDQIGTSTLNGFISAYFNTREIAPLVAALALSATVGSGFTAQLGAMRINEEVDALTVMAVPSVPYLVTTRVIAGFIAIIPLYVIGLLTSYAGARFVTIYLYGQSAGTYDHYFNLFLPPIDILLSFAKVLVFSVLIILIHCRLGFKAAGGPAGVGIAVGTAVRRSIVTVAVLDLLLSMALWGTTTTVRIAG